MMTNGKPGAFFSSDYDLVLLDQFAPHAVQAFDALN
jgi:hypothetical protein